MRSSLGLGLGVAQAASAGGGGGPVPSEKVANPTLAGGTGMTTPQGGWTIGDGTAENTIMLRQLRFATTGNLEDAMEPQIQVGISANPNVATVQIEALKSADSTFQIIGEEAMGATGMINIPSATVAGGPYDTIRIRCAGDAGVIITYLSVIA